MQRLIGFLRLTRPANIVTAISDIVAGAAIASMVSSVVDISSILWLVLATVGLYGGGVVFNDVFDADLDRVERPERAIPSGLISVKEGALLGACLLFIGVVAASFVALWPSGILAFAIAIAALVYDKWGKHHPFFGPLNMGLCRGLNLLLGLSVVPDIIHTQYVFIFVTPIIYIAAITMISRGEVHGSRSKTLVFAAFLYLLVITTITYTAIHYKNLPVTLALLILFIGLIAPPLGKAIQEPLGKNIGKAVKAGVIALIIMNAAWAAAFGAFWFALIALALLPVSLLLAKAFAVT